LRPCFFVGWAETGSRLKALPLSIGFFFPEVVREASQGSNLSLFSGYFGADQNKPRPFLRLRPFFCHEMSRQFFRRKELDRVDNEDPASGKEQTHIHMA
jgi:hypothetical protein